jgi:hypothetical protein
MAAIACWRRIAGTVAILLSVSTSAACAQDWARAMFDHTSHDFGVVARGAKVEHRFIVENIYEEDVHIQSVESSCGCSTPQVNRTLLKTWEKAEILVTVDTRGFLGRKDATIKVLFDRPLSTEFQLHVHTYIRSDIVVQPGEVSFGSVMQGTEARQTLAVTYAGRDDWRIARVECANPAIEATAAETSRTPGQVGYSLSVRLKPDAPPGYVRDQLVLVTNDYDARAARVPVAVEGLVVSALTVRPSPLLMGVAEPGKPLVRSIVVQGRAPFRILSVHSSDERFQCQPPSEAKSAHVLPVTLSLKGAKPSTATLSAKLHIETDLAGAKAVDVDVSAQIPPGDAAKP